MFPKLAPGSNLLLGDCGLLGGQKSRLGLAIHCLRQAAVGTMAGLLVVGASAAGLATSNRAIGY